MAMRAFYNYHFSEPTAPPVPIPSDVDLSLNNIKYTKTREGVPLWTLVATSAHLLGDGVTMIKDVQITFFNKDKGDLIVTAMEGKLVPADESISVNSQVVVTVPSGHTLKTDVLEYVEKDNLLQTDSVAQISSDDYIVTGKGIEIDITERSLALLHNIRAQFGNPETFETEWPDFTQETPTYIQKDNRN